MQTEPCALVQRKETLPNLEVSSIRSALNMGFSWITVGLACVLSFSLLFAHLRMLSAAVHYAWLNHGRASVAMMRDHSGWMTAKGLAGQESPSYCDISFCGLWSFFGFYLSTPGMAFYQLYWGGLGEWKVGITAESKGKMCLSLWPVFGIQEDPMWVFWLHVIFPSLWSIKLLEEPHHPRRDRQASLAFLKWLHRQFHLVLEDWPCLLVFPPNHLYEKDLPLNGWVTGTAQFLLLH